VAKRGLPCAAVPTRKVLSAISLVVVSAAALAVFATSSPTRGDLIFGLGAWLVFVAFTTLCGSVMLGLLFGVRQLLKRRMARDSAMAIATMVIGAAAAFPSAPSGTRQGSAHLAWSRPPKR